MSKALRARLCVFQWYPADPRLSMLYVFAFLSIEKHSARLYLWGDWLCQLGGKKTYQGVISAQAGSIIHTQQRRQRSFYLRGHRKQLCKMNVIMVYCMHVCAPTVHSGPLFESIVCDSQQTALKEDFMCVCECVFVLCMLCSNTKVSRQICDPAEALSSSGTSQLHVKGTHQKQPNNKCTNIFHVRSARC